MQDLLDELETFEAGSALRLRNVLQKLRLILSEARHVTISPPAQKTFDAEGAILERALTRSAIRNNAIKSLCSSVRRLRDAADNSVLGLENRFQVGISGVTSAYSHGRSTRLRCFLRRFCNGRR